LIADETGKSLRERLEGRLDRATAKNQMDRAAKYAAQLKTPPFPPCLGYLWDAYHRIRRRKGAGINGPSPIEWPDIDAFVRLSGVHLAPWEIDLIETIDDIFLRSPAEMERIAAGETKMDSRKGRKKISRNAQ
jgi:hypothetical protein